MTEAQQIAAFLATRGITRVKQGAATVTWNKGDAKLTPDDRRAKYAMKADDGESDFGGYCEDAPCCGCCGKDGNGGIMRKGRSW